MTLARTIRRNKGRCGATAAIVALGALVALVGGCKPKAHQGAPRGPVAQADARDALFDTVADNLGRLEEFDINQMMPQICDRLNQWYQQEKPAVAWQPDPLILGLPEDLRRLPVMRTLDLMQFRLPDAWYLQETVWLRDASNGARADQFDDVAVAERLFDWTVRNIQLEEDLAPTDELKGHRPYETMLYGRGTALERAWIFILLARQQGLDVVLLGLADEDGGNVRSWLPALVSGGQLYLFDCRLGLPIPGPDGKGVATLEQVAADEQLLRQLDLGDDQRYDVTADDLRHVVALIEASPHSLSKRMALVESRLAGAHKLLLTSPGSALAERVKQLKHVGDAQLWRLPFEIWQAQSRLSERGRQTAMREMIVFQAVPSLMTGRALYFKGAFDGENGAKLNFMNARPSDAEIDNYRLPADLARDIKREELPMAEAARIVVMRHAKQDASFWLGLVCFEEKDYPVAIDFFANRTLAASPNGPWAPAARYNLARTYEAQGKTGEAIALYEADDSPQSHGNKLRARRLREQSARAEVE